MLVISLFYGMDPHSYAAETKGYEFIRRCETVDEETESSGFEDLIQKVKKNHRNGEF